MNFAKRVRILFASLLGLAFVVTLAALFVTDRDSVSRLQNLAERLAASDKQKLQVEAAQKGLDALAPLAGQVDGRRVDLQAGVQDLAVDPGLRALFASANPAAMATKSNPKAKPETLQQILTRVAASKAGVWLDAVVTLKDGRVVAAWPNSPSGTLKDLPLFKQMASPEMQPGIAISDFQRVEASAQLGKDGKALPGAKAGFESRLTLACGIEGVDGNFAGLVLVHTRAESLLGIDPLRSLKSLTAASPKGSAILMRGTGEQVFHSTKAPYLENFSQLPDLKDAMASMQGQSSGRQWVKSYDGKPSLLVWKRIGAWSQGQDPAALLTLVGVMPEDDLKIAAASQSVDRPKPFFARPGVLVLLLLAFGLPLGLGWVLLAKAGEGARRTLAAAGQIDEFGMAPEGLEFNDSDADPELARVNASLNALLKRAASSEARARELDGALRRVEDQASKDATSAAQELSELRSKNASLDAERQAANAKFEAAQKARSEAESQLANLKSALETAQRSIELKNSEAKNLSTQAQDLMKALEEQRKVAQQAQEGVAKRDDELVRLSAVNTLSSELKATLTVIKNYISTMLGSVGAISDAQQEFLGVVINKSARLERLIADLVELSEIGSGIKPPRFESVTPSALVQEALLNTRPQADHKKISLEFAESGAIPSISVDKEKISAIFRALLAQAVKVTSRGERVSILVSTRDNGVELRFADPGMSLPPDRAAKVFTQFHGVDSQAGPEFIGTGLRFPIMRAVVESHGGKIWIESQVGRGKTFVIALPKAGAFTPRATSPSLGTPAEAVAMPAGIPEAPKPAPSQAEAAKFDSIFGEMPGEAPKPAAPGLPPLAPPPKPAIPGLPPLAPPPMAPAPKAEMPGLPALPGLPPLPSAPKDSAPAPLPGLPAFGSAPAAPSIKPPKLEDLAANPALGGNGAPVLPPPKAEPAGLPTAPGTTPDGPKPSGLPKIELPKPGEAPVLKTNPQLGEQDTSNFDAIFGAPPAKPEGAAPGGLPKVELKTKADLGDGDLANFAAIFGGGAPAGAPPPPPPPAPKAPAGDLSSFDAIFGDSAKPAAPPPPPPPPAAPKPLAPPPPPPPGAVPPMPADLAGFDAIFGGAPGAPGAPKMPPPPPPPAPGPASGGLNTLDDLNDMLQGS